mmetsp:Transcript_76227/g.176876  ORF Transcript_76227/g.176876 Transcript_76227/m.176876 type:complete len:113 (-) Transcript_76227:46-384(-)
MASVSVFHLSSSLVEAVTEVRVLVECTVCVCVLEPAGWSPQGACLVRCIEERWSMRPGLCTGAGRDRTGNGRCRLLPMCASRSLSGKHDWLSVLSQALLPLRTQRRVSTTTT